MALYTAIMLCGEGKCLPIAKSKDVGHCKTVEARSQVPDHQLRPQARVVFCPCIIILANWTLGGEVQCLF